MPDDIDPQADAVIDKLLAELKEAEIKGEAVRAASQPPPEPSEVKPPVPRSALYKKIQEKGGDLSQTDIMKLVAKEVRKGI